MFFKLFIFSNLFKSVLINALSPSIFVSWDVTLEAAEIEIIIFFDSHSFSCFYI
jgi:hypothetical protein